jgi:MFS family permease
MREAIPEVTPHRRVGGREWYLPNALRALRHHNFRLYWLGQLISLTGTWMQSTAQQWLVFKLTGSPLALGTVMFVQFLPSLLFSLFAGVVVDRVDRRRLLLGLQVIMMILALGLSGLTFTGLVQYWHVVVMAVLLGLCNTFDQPTRHAFTLDISTKDDLPNAIALNSSMFNGARLIGPAAAGLIVARVGEAAAFLLNGLSFLAVIAGLLMMRLPPFTPKAGRPRPVADLIEGLRYIVTDRQTLALMVIVAVPSIFGFPINTLIPVMAGGVLGLGADGFGILVSSLGLGALAGAVTLAVLGGYQPKGRLLTAATFVYALAAFGFGFSRAVPLSMLALMLMGWGMITHLATTNTLLQLHLPDELRGRVISAYLWVVVGMSPIGSLTFGSLAEAWGAPNAILAGAGVCLLSAVLTVVFLPRVRRME